MTLIVAAKKGNETLLVADCMATDRETKAHSYTCKMGLLLPGITYAATGSCHSYQKFILKVKEILDGTHGSPVEFLNRLNKFANNWPSERKDYESEYFCMFLQCRNGRSSDLYIFDSDKNNEVGRLSEDGIIGAGSGSEEFNKVLPTFMQALEKTNKDIRMIDLCFVLTNLANQWAIGVMKQRGLDNHFGGRFVFSHQNGQKETLQPNTINYVCVPDFKNKRLFTYIYPMFWHEDILMLGDGETRMLDCIIDFERRPSRTQMNSQDILQLKEELNRSADTLLNEAEYHCYTLIFAHPDFLGCQMHYIDTKQTKYKNMQMPDFIKKSIDNTMTQHNLIYN